MTDSTAVAVRKPLDLETWQLVKEVAPALQASRFFGVTPEQAVAIVLKGVELGIGPAAAFEFIQVIQGRPTLSPRGALALVLRSGLLDGLTIDEAPDRCTVTMRRRGGLEYKTTFSLADAQRASLVKPGSAWTAYPANMMRWRCVGFVIDVLFPDVTCGARRADEFGATVDAEGEVVEAEAVTVPSPPS